MCQQGFIRSSIVGIHYSQRGESEFTRSVDYIYYIIGTFSQAFVIKADSATQGYVGRTKDFLWAPIIQSSRYLGSGFYDGTLIVGDYKSVLLAINGDADFCVNLFELPGFWSSSNPCVSCRVVSPPMGSPMHYLNVSPDATWKSIKFKHVFDWCAHCSDRMSVLCFSWIWCLLRFLTDLDASNRGYPVMSGKGAECRNLIPVLRSVFAHHYCRQGPFRW